MLRGADRTIAIGDQESFCGENLVMGIGQWKRIVVRDIPTVRLAGRILWCNPSLTRIGRAVRLNWSLIYSVVLVNWFCLIGCGRIRNCWTFGLIEILCTSYQAGFVVIYSVGLAVSWIKGTKWICLRSNSTLMKAVDWLIDWLLIIIICCLFFFIIINDHAVR